MDSRLFQDVLHYTEADLGSAARQTCLGCHSPLAAMTGDSALRTKVSWEGVTCDVCHSIREVSLTGPIRRRVRAHTHANGAVEGRHSQPARGSFLAPAHILAALRLLP